ncbi:hypothetical protein BJX96DRAFT_145419 [Aspergillus floccosus]
MSTAVPMQQFHFPPLPSSPLSPRSTTTTPLFSTTMTSNNTSPSTSIFTFSPSPSNTLAAQHSQTPRHQPPSPSNFSAQSTTTPTKAPASKYAQRYTTISNPLLNAPPRTYTASASPSARTARRNLFLNRIKQDRDNGRFETRGEQLVLMEHVAEQKMWGEAMRRRADGLLSAEMGVLEEMEMGDASGMLFRFEVVGLYPDC